MNNLLRWFKSRTCPHSDKHSTFDNTILHVLVHLLTSFRALMYNLPVHFSRTMSNNILRFLFPVQDLITCLTSTWSISRLPTKSLSSSLFTFCLLIDCCPTLKTFHATVSLKVDALMLSNENGNFEICRRKSFWYQFRQVFSRRCFKHFFIHISYSALLKSNIFEQMEIVHIS